MDAVEAAETPVIFQKLFPNLNELSTRIGGITFVPGLLEAIDPNNTEPASTRFICSLSTPLQKIPRGKWGLYFLLLFGPPGFPPILYIGTRLGTAQTG